VPEPDDGGEANDDEHMRQGRRRGDGDAVGVSVPGQVREVLKEGRSGGECMRKTMYVLETLLYCVQNDRLLTSTNVHG
jgi:hypothetical protein